MASQSKFNGKLAVCIALFSFANYVTQPLYSAFVPVLLSERLESAAEIGAILSCCNILTMLIHPLVGELSDRTRCRYGRRRPYILSGAVACGISFAIIPWMHSLWQFALVLAVYSLMVSFWRAPVSAIQIDCVPPEHITRANAISSCMLALSSVFAYLSGNRLTAIGLDLRWVFALGGAAAIVVALIGCVTVHEQDSRAMTLPGKGRVGIASAFLSISKDKRKKMACLLLLVICAYVANYAFEYYFVLFCSEQAGMEAGRATLYLAFYMAAYCLAAAVFSGLRRSLSEGAMVGSTLIAFLSVEVISLVFCLSGKAITGWLWAFCLIYGISWGTFNIYMYPLLLKFNGASYSGNLMGMYYTCTGLAGTVSPVLYGLVYDMSGTYVSLFVFCGCGFAGAGILLLLSRFWRWANQPGQTQQI